MTGEVKTYGIGWTRRTEEEYISLFAEHNLFVIETHKYQRSLFFLAIRYFLDPLRRKYFPNDANAFYSYRAIRIFEGLLFQIFKWGKSAKNTRESSEWNTLFILRKA
jgi:hypothetical protein